MHMLALMEHSAKQQGMGKLLELFTIIAVEGTATILMKSNQEKISMEIKPYGIISIIAAVPRKDIETLNIFQEKLIFNV